MKKAPQNNLTTTQKEILLLLEQGYARQRAADKLGISVNILNAQTSVIFRALRVHTKTAAVAKAIRKKII